MNMHRRAGGMKQPLVAIDQPIITHFNRGALTRGIRETPYRIFLIWRKLAKPATEKSARLGTPKGPVYKVFQVIWGSQGLGRPGTGEKRRIAISFRPKARGKRSDGGH